MTIVSRLFAVALLSIAFCATSFAGGPFGIIRVGKWQGAAYTTEKGAFSHCTAVAKFDTGSALVLLQNADHTWIVGVIDPSSRVRDGESLSLALTFDDQAKYEIAATAGPKKVVLGVLPSAALNAFRKSHQLVATASKQTLQFDLNAAGNVIAAIEYCVDKINTNGIARPAIFPIQSQSRRRRKPPRNRKKRHRTPRPTQENWLKSREAVLSSVRMRISSPTITSSPTASVISTAISPGRRR